MKERGEFENPLSSKKCLFDYLGKEPINPNRLLRFLEIYKSQKGGLQYEINLKFWP